MFEFSSLLTMEFALRGPATNVQALLDSYSATLPIRTWYRFVVGLTTTHPQLGGGTHYIEGFKSDGNYEWQTATIYSVEGVQVKKRSKSNGTWITWV